MDVSVEFIIGLPKLGNKLVIMVVFDRLSKYTHFFSLRHPFTTTLVAQVFMDKIFKLHGMLTYIVFDQGPTFTRKFLQELFNLYGMQLQMSTTYHPSTNGQTEGVKNVWRPT